MATVMGQTQSVIVQAIRDLCWQEHADDHRRVAMADGSVRVRLYRDGQHEPTSVWLVFGDGRPPEQAEITTRDRRAVAA